MLIKMPQMDVWSLCGWASDKPPKCIPSLRGPNGLVSISAKQELLLITVFFPLMTTNVLHSLLSDLSPWAEHDFPTITLVELLKVLQQTSNTSAPDISG